MHYEMGEWILERVKIDKTTGCWNWLKGKNAGGYGVVAGSKWATKYGKNLAPQISYIARYGRYNKELHVLHGCGNTACCNPEHLYLAPYSSKYKIPKEDLIAITNLISKLSTKSIAKLFNISERTVEKIESNADFLDLHK